MNNLIFCQNRLISFLACSKLPGKNNHIIEENDYKTSAADLATR